MFQPRNLSPYEFLPVKENRPSFGTDQDSNASLGYINLCSLWSEV